MLKRATLKTTSTTNFENALHLRTGVSEEVWKHKLGRWTSMLSMSGYIGRRKALDRFWTKKADLEKSRVQRHTMVVFGHAKFSSTGQRERAVPRKAMEAAASRFPSQVVKVYESFSTKVCSCCHMPTKSVVMMRWIRNKDGEMKKQRVEIRELRRCVSNACSASPYKSRDKDAAINILQIFLAGLEVSRGWWHTIVNK